MASERRADDEARRYEWEQHLVENGLLDPDQPTEAAHARFLEQPHVRRMRADARRRAADAAAVSASLHRDL